MLEIHQLNKTYADGTCALKQLNFNAGPGIVGLLGPNGAGKSTLLRTIASLQSADSGEIYFDQLNVRQQPSLLRAQLGYLPQEFGIYPHLSCRALLEHIAILKGLTDRSSRQQQIEQLLAQTNLTQAGDKKVAHFSGGMRQRFGIAQALLGAPKLLILDEPAAGLDPQERQQLHNLLAEISTTCLVLLSSHLVDDIEQICPQVAIMLAGRILLNGPTQQLIDPLAGQVWLHSGALLALPAGCLLLQRSFLRGVEQHRVFAKQCPGVNFMAVPPTLQDCYYLTLLQAKESASNTENKQPAQLVQAMAKPTATTQESV